MRTIFTLSNFKTISKTNRLSSLLIILLFPLSIFSQVTTYYSTANGNINDAIWATSPTGSALGTAPTFNTNSNLVVRHIVEVTTNGTTIRNLTINAGGRLWRNSALNSEIIYINIQKPSDNNNNINIIVNGVLGNPDINISDMLGFNLNVVNGESSTIIISGTGTANFGRIRKNSGGFDSSTDLVLDMNLKLGFNGTVIFNNSSSANINSSSVFNITINEGKTLNVTSSVGALAISGQLGDLSEARSGGYNILGTVNVENYWHRNGDEIGGQAMITTIGANGRLNVKNLFVLTERSGFYSSVLPFTINTGGKVTVLKNGKLTLFNGGLATNNGLIINDGAIILHGQGTPGLSTSNVIEQKITGNVTIKKQGIAFALKYNYWSSPVIGATLSSLTSGAGFIWSENAALNLYYYNPLAATSSTPSGLLNGWISASTSDSMQAARGYITTNANLATFTGGLRNGTVNYTLQGNSNSRMNLIGNPYATPISADAFLNLPANANKFDGNTLYFWVDNGSQGANYSNEDYLSYNGVIATHGDDNVKSQFNAKNRVISVAQGFVVSAQSAAVGTNITFNNSMRRDEVGVQLFSNSELPVARFHITNQNGARNETVVAFREDLTDGIDNHFDAMKMIGNANLSLYTVVDNKNLVIDGYGELNTNRVIRLGVNAKAGEIHKIELAELENFDPSVLIFLEKIETGEFHNLRLAPYTFQGGANVHGELFNIHFKEPIKLTASNESCDFGVGKININIPTEGWNYKVKNSDGLTVNEANNVIGQGIIDNLNAGNYTIIMTYTDGYSFEKFVTIDAAVPVRSSFVVSENEVSIANAIVEFNANIECATEFHWDFGDGNMISDINNPVHAYMMAGEYTVTLTAKNETCTSISTSSIKVSEVTTDISNVDNQNEVLLYPNPAIDHSNVLLNVDKSETQVKISIYDVSGRLVSSTNAKDVRSGSILTLDVKELKSGIYDVVVEGNAFRTVRKLNISK